MPVAENRLTNAYRRLGLETCGAEHSVWENRVWREQPAEKRELPRQWFVGREPRPRSSIWFVPRLRDLNWLDAPVKQERPDNDRISVSPQIQEAIELSKWILELEENWDEQGSSKYAKSTWERACHFLIRQAKFSLQISGKGLPSPKILPGPEASIDLHWKMERFELLINIPESLSKPATFYGDDYGALCIRGNLNPSKPVPGLVVWLLS